MFLSFGLFVYCVCCFCVLYTVAILAMVLSFVIVVTMQQSREQRDLKVSQHVSCVWVRICFAILRNLDLFFTVCFTCIDEEKRHHAIRKKTNEIFKNPAKTEGEVGPIKYLSPRPHSIVYLKMFFLFLKQIELGFFLVDIAISMTIYVFDYIVWFCF